MCDGNCLECGCCGNICVVGEDIKSVLGDILESEEE